MSFRTESATECVVVAVVSHIRIILMCTCMFFVVFRSGVSLLVFFRVSVCCVFDVFLSVFVCGCQYQSN